MKKLLVLTLVLGIASLASAALSMSVSGDTTVGGTFYVTLGGAVPGDFDTYEMYDAYEGYAIGANAADFTESHVWTDNGNGNNAAGNLSGSVFYAPGFDGPTWTADETDDGDPLTDAVSGDWITFEMIGVAEGIFTLVQEVDGTYANPVTKTWCSAATASHNLGKTQIP